MSQAAASRCQIKNEFSSNIIEEWETKIRTEVNKIANKHLIEKINQVQNLFFLYP